MKSYVASDPNPTAMIAALLAAGVGETKGTAMKSYLVRGLRPEPHGDDRGGRGAVGPAPLAGGGVTQA